MIITLNFFFFTLQIESYSCWCPYILPLRMPHSFNDVCNFLNIGLPGCSSNHATYCNNCRKLFLQLSRNSRVENFATWPLLFAVRVFDGPPLLCVNEPTSVVVFPTISPEL